MNDLCPKLSSSCGITPSEEAEYGQKRPLLYSFFSQCFTLHLASATQAVRTLRSELRGMWRPRHAVTGAVSAGRRHIKADTDQKAPKMKMLPCLGPGNNSRFCLRNHLPWQPHLNISVGCVVSYSKNNTATQNRCVCVCARAPASGAN